MAYNAVAQIDEVASHSGSDSDSSRTSSPVHGPSHQLGFDDKSGLAQLTSMISSMTPTSYDVVEADDYDADPSPARRSSSPHRLPPLDTAVARHVSAEAPLRSASSDLSIPLNHPTPDLQSLQGAYIGNVERLEQSAERMSSSSADIGSEIRKLDLEQKRRSCSSASNSIAMRNGAFCSGTVVSPLGSTISTRQRSVSGGSRLAQVAEPAHDEYTVGHLLEHSPAPLSILHAPQPPVADQSQGAFGQHGLAGEIERPSTAGSGDTYQQARTLFTDFNGVHFAPLECADSGLRLSLSQPPLASKPESFKEPQKGEHMVYYPAPVPRMLNLPPKLSRKPIADRQKRRTQILTSIAADDGKSAPGLAGATQEENNGSKKDKHLSTAPPQLRASVFFDQPSTTLEVEVKHDSAVATLDSILDASAHAPVSAFTDHPYAGHVGSYVYGKPKRKTISKDPTRQRERHSQLLMDQQHSTNACHVREGSINSSDGRPGNHSGEPQYEHGFVQTEGFRSEGDDTSSGSEEEEQEGADYVGPPNTLLAELELRKHELKQRRRTALPTTARGTHATLLELDAMAQNKSEKRRRRPVTLAWGNRDADDDDVPLAMLYPDKANSQDDDRPLGLMERQQLEENEPLSTRRARLRGEPIPEKRPAAVHVGEASEQGAESGDEGETLGERMRRLRGQNPKESHFAQELLAEFDQRAGTIPKETDVAPEETLAQRRNRLRKKNARPANQKNLPMRRSIAALPQSRPAHVSRKVSCDVFPQPNMMQQYGNRMSIQSVRPNVLGYHATAGYGHPMQQPYGYGMAIPRSQSYYGFQGLGMPASCGPTMARQQPIDPMQRDVIDRWRQSIR